jgi:penicillin amidase
MPRIVDPPSGRIWSANQRMVGGAALEQLGDGGYALGARAQQIRDALLATERATPADMLRLQLDDRALFLARWRTLLLETLDRTPADPRRAALRGLVENWGGHASIESAGYRIVRTFRAVLLDDVFGRLASACFAADHRFSPALFPQREAPVWRLLTARPTATLDPRYPSWDACILAAIDTTLARFAPDPQLASRTWGERNTTRIRHPISRGVPQLARWLDMPQRPLPGDSNLPRVQTPSGGASQRMVVSPGLEEDGIFHMPGGQSGHPLSKHYRDGHAAWEEGRPTPFLPGPPVHRLILRKAAAKGERH